MVDLVKWKPFRGLFQDFFEDFSPFFNDRRPLIRDDIDFLPKLDIRNTEKELQVTVDLPGIDKQDLDVKIEDGILFIKGEKKGEKREEKDGYTYYERSLGRFERRVRLPEDVEESQLKAEYKDGVLTLTAPRHKLEKPQPKKIEIK